MGDQKFHLLIVDDNRVERMKLTRMLESEGNTISVANDGYQALEILRERTFDLVLLDVVMPGMDGFQVLQAMKAESAMPRTPVIMISAMDESDISAKCASLGAEDYISKSSDPELFKARITSCLEK